MPLVEKTPATSPVDSGASHSSRASSDRSKKIAVVLFSALLIISFAFIASDIPKRNTNSAPVGGVSTKLDNKKIRTKSARSWFSSIRKSCNSVEVEAEIQNKPAPEGVMGSAYTATCLVLAGKPDRSREVLDELGAANRAEAAMVVFNTIHPIADRGDDMATLPGMLVVLDYMPNNYQALYHAGIAEAQLGKFEEADAHLTKFLNLYTRNDHFTRKGRQVLEKVRTHRRNIQKIEGWQEERQRNLEETQAN